jgi:hypothetical protein
MIKKCYRYIEPINDAGIEIFSDVVASRVLVLKVLK